MASGTVKDFVRRAEKAEKEIEDLLSELSNLEKCWNGDVANSEFPEDLEKLQLENKKLQYRLAILQRATEMSSASKKAKPSASIDDALSMPSIAQLLIDFFRSAICKAYPDLGMTAPCPVTLSATQADYQFNGAMAIAGILKVIFQLDLDAQK